MRPVFSSILLGGDLRLQPAANPADRRQQLAAPLQHRPYHGRGHAGATACGGLVLIWWKRPLKGMPSTFNAPGENDRHETFLGTPSRSGVAGMGCVDAH